MRVACPLFLAACAVLVTVSAPDSRGQTRTPASDTVLVSAAWLAERLGRPELVVLHVGAKADYDEGHIPGARHLLPNSFVAQGHEQGHEPTLMTQVPALATLDSVLESVGVSDRSRIVIYGRSLTSVGRLYMTLDHVGLGSRTSILDGGLAVWREQGKPVNTQPRAHSRRAHTAGNRSSHFTGPGKSSRYRRAPASAE